MTPVQRVRRMRVLRSFGAFLLTTLPFSSLGFGQICSKHAPVTEQGVGSWGSYDNRTSDHRIMVEVAISQSEIKTDVGIHKGIQLSLYFGHGDPAASQTDSSWRYAEACTSLRPGVGQSTS